MATVKTLHFTLITDIIPAPGWPEGRAGAQGAPPPKKNTIWHLASKASKGGIDPETSSRAADLQQPNFVPLAKMATVKTLHFTLITDIIPAPGWPEGRAGAQGGGLGRWNCRCVQGQKGNTLEQL